MEIQLPIFDKPTEVYDPYLAEYWESASNRTFYIDGEIDENTYVLQRHIININLDDKDKNIPKEKRKPIVIFIDSPGGYLATSMALATTIKMSDTPIYTVGLGEVCSGASIIFIAGHKRMLMPYASVLIHSGGTNGMSGTYEQVQESTKSYKKQIEQMRNFILENTEIPLNIFKKNQSKEWYLTSDECVKYKIADLVISSLDDIYGE